MAERRVKRRLLIAIALVLIVSMAIVIVTMTPRSYAFIDEFAGQRSLKEEMQLAGIAEGMGGAPPNSVKVECYLFKAPADKVLAAITKELTRDGWRIVEKDEIDVIFSKGKEIVFFDKKPYVDEAPDATCMITLRRAPDWLTTQWDALKKRMGWD